MKKLFLFILLTGFILSGYAQCDYYMPLKEGKGVQMQNFNAKDKLQGYSDTKITKITSEGNVTNATLQSTSYDAKNKEEGKSEFNIKCTGNKMVFDAKMFIPQAMLEGYKDMEVKVESSTMEFPGSLNVGDALPDGSMKMIILQNGQQFSQMDFLFYNRKVEGKESITVPAGTYDCFKITYNIKMTSNTFGIKMNVETKNIEYCAKSVGVVKTMFYDQKGKLSGYNVMSKIY